MPALPSPGAVLQVEIRVGDNASIEAGSRFFLSYSGGPPNTTDLNTLATDVANQWETNIAPYVASAESLHGVIITDLSSATGAVGTWTGTKAGSSTGAALPSSGATVINHQISRRYRGGKPKTFLRMGTQDDMNGTNEWGSTYLTNATNEWHDFIAAILAVSTLSITLTNIINVSYYQGFTSVLNPVTGRTKDVAKVRTTPVKDNITNSTAATKIGSQRRRLNL